MTEFEANVKENKGFIKTGKITSQKLVPFIGKKVKVKVKEVKEKNK